MTVQTRVRGTFRPPQFSVNTHDHEIREACEKKEEENIRIKTSFVIHSQLEWLGLRSTESRNLALCRKMKSENSWETDCQESEMDLVKKLISFKKILST